MELIKILNKFDKSKIKAGDGRKDGIYPLYTCSPKVNKFLDNYLYDTEAIILGTGGNPVINYHKGKFSYSSDCLVVQSKGKFENKYIYYYLISKINEIAKMFRGAGLKHLNKKEFFKMNIELINIEEQKKIIKELDLINKLMDYKRKQIKLFDDFIKSQFVEMFGDIKIYKRLSDYSILITKGASPKWQGINYKRKGTLFITSENVREGYIDISKPKYLENKINEILPRSILRKEDILINIVGASIGRAAKYNYEYLANINQAVALVRTKNISDLKIPKAPITLQNQFSEIVKQIDKQKFEIEKSLKETQELYESLMEKYFG